MRESYGFLQVPLFVREGSILVLGQAEGEGGFGYDWLSSGGEVKLYGVKEGDQAVLIETNGEERGVLKIGSEGEIEGFDLLKGNWTVSKLG